jgi:protein SCO1/2
MKKNALLTLLVLVVCIAISWGLGSMALRKDSVESSYRLGGDFTLLDTRGQAFHSTSLHGNYVLLYFGYSFCPDICPTGLQRMTSALEQLPTADAAQIVPVFISVDPERDTPAALHEYIHNFHPRFVALTGTPAQLTSIAKQYSAYFHVNKSSENDKDYSVDHSSFIYVLDKQGQYVSHFTHETDVAVMVQRLKTMVEGK